MLWNMLCYTLQSMGRTNYKFPIDATRNVLMHAPEKSTIRLSSLPFLSFPPLPFFPPPPLPFFPSLLPFFPPLPFFPSPPFLSLPSLSFPPLPFFPSRSLDSVSPAMLPHFREAAEQLVKDRGAVDVVASALAYISGAKEIVSRSLLSAQQVRCRDGRRGWGWGRLEHLAGLAL